MTKLEFPIVLVAKLYHIGTLNKENKGIYFPRSYEANCLSVSDSPHAWQKIAKLGGYPLHRLFNDSGFFLNAHAIRKTNAFSHVLHFGRTNRLIKQVKRYRAWEFDCEEEGWKYSLFNTKEEASLAIGIADLSVEEIRKLDRPRGHQLIEYVTINIMTQKLADLLSIEKTEDDASDELMIAFGQFETDADGVYWDDNYDPDNLSAPRAGIFPNRLERWEIKKTDFEKVEDKTTIILKKIKIIEIKK